MKVGSDLKRIAYKGVVVCACFFGLTGAAGAAGADKIPPTILMDGRILAKSKQRIQGGDAALKPAFDQLVKEANKALNVGPFSVMNKTKIPPSGDKHDYASYARYWWPDPKKPDGLPYIHRDGETNPKSQGSAESDRRQMDMMVDGVETLGLAYYLTGNEKYAEKAAQLLRVWFLDPETRMNPNLNYSQGIPGKEPGNKSGVIDSRIMIRALDGALLIYDSTALSASDQAALRAWAGQFLDWLQTGDIARQEWATSNNHGTFFDVQAMYFALFSGKPAVAIEVAETAIKKRILAQIQPDGTMPEELDRTRSLHYSIFNLQAFFELARLAEQTDVDLWHAADSRIKAALNFLAPYADPARPWPQKDVIAANRADILWPLLYAAEKYKDDSYRQTVEKLPAADREGLLGNLVFPLMR